MELNNVIENLKANLKSKQEELDTYSNKAKEAEVSIYKLVGALELAGILQDKAKEDVPVVPTEEVKETD